MKINQFAVCVVLMLLITTSVQAIWDPDTDSALLFNMNFEVYDNYAHTTTDAKAGLLGTLGDYNTINPDVFGETSLAGLGVDANFAAIHDFAPGAGVDDSGISIPNDVKLSVPSASIFQLGYLSTNKHTWTFWFNVPNLVQGTVLRHASAYLQEEGYKDLLWEIRIQSGKLMFYHKNNSLQMETASTLSDLGLTVNTWHHAAVVIDGTNSKQTTEPTTQLSTKIYIDGLEVPVIVTALNTQKSMNIDNDPYYDSPLWIGAGQREFDGLLDDVRLYNRSLTALEVSILNQPDRTVPRALLPIPRSSDVVIGTGLSWEPAGSTPAPTAQKVYFSDDPYNFGSPVKTGSGTMNSVTNAELGGQLALNTTYYWYVQSTIGGVDVNGPVWSFTTETGRAINPSPADNAEDIDVCDVNLSWATPTAATYAVYASPIRALVESNDVSVRIANGISEPCIMGYDPCSRGTIIYWRVNSTYGGSIGTVPGTIWSFRTKPYELVFNTDDAETTYADHIIPAYTCVLHSDGWSDPCATGYLASDGVAVFNFPNGFNYDRRYDIIVVPKVRPEWIDINIPTPLEINVTGDFYFDGRIQIAGDNIMTTTEDVSYARSGGYPGPKHNQEESVFKTGTQPPLSDYWTSYLYNPADTSVIFHTRYNNTTSNSGTAHYIFEPTALARSHFGPGVPVSPPYKGGGGGGAGGMGGESGRGYFHGVDTRGPSYGDKEVPVPFGGSGGGWGGSSSPGGAAGGGGIAIVATGNVTFDVNSQILAQGGSQLCPATSYPAGGGGGGSVKIIAGGSVTLKGLINANGGKGGNGTSGNNTGGGGGGGRVAIFYGTTYSNSGTISANGGQRGATYSDPCATGLPAGLATNGQNGTIYIVNTSAVSPKKASAPTPKNGARLYYPDPCTIKLKWYSGYGATTDEVFCDTNPNPTTSRGVVAATRGQHDVNMPVTAGNTYYMKVVTDGVVTSDIWSFTVVNWNCPIAFPGAYPHPAGLEWDSNHDCVIDFEDLAYFVEDWLNGEFGQYRLEFVDFSRFASEWELNVRQ